MGNVFKISELRCVIGWPVFIIDISFIFFLALISYLFLKSLEVQINSIGHQNEKIISMIKIVILFVILLITENEIIRHFVSFDFFKTAWFSASALIVFSGLYFISGFVLDVPVHLSSVLFLFFLVFLIFKMAATFLNNKCVRNIPHDRNMMISGLY